MRILVLNWKDPQHPEAGGAELYVQQLTRGWSDGGHEVTLFVPESPGCDAHSAGMTLIRRGDRRSVFDEARRHLAASGGTYDRVIESVSTRPFGAHRFVGARSVALYHQIADEVWRHEFALPVAMLGRHVIEPRWLRSMRPARVVAVSPSTAADLRRFDVECEAIVSPGCHLPDRQDREPPGERPKLVYIGRLVRTKRPADALAAFQQIREAFPAATLDIVGRGYLQGALAQRAQPGVTVHGYVSEEDKQRLLASAHLLLFPATREGWGIVAMEAAGHGVPTVGYDVPGVRDAVAHDVSGVLAAADPACLAQAAIALLRDPRRWLRLSSGARDRAERHTWQRTLQAWAGILDDHV